MFVTLVNIVLLRVGLHISMVYKSFQNGVGIRDFAKRDFCYSCVLHYAARETCFIQASVSKQWTGMKELKASAGTLGLLMFFFCVL